MMDIKILRSKTDQLRLGDTVVVARIGTPTCPVALLESYLVQQKMTATSYVGPYKTQKMGKS